VAVSSGLVISLGKESWVSSRPKKAEKALKEVALGAASGWRLARDGWSVDGSKRAEGLLAVG
jgi:hypothetical protein